MVSVKAININDLPRVSNVNYQEDRIIKSLDKIDILQERYKCAIEYMHWFMPAWNSLNENEKDILKGFYMSDNLKAGATKHLSEVLYRSEATIDRMRRKSLNKLRMFLYGE